MGHVKEYWKAVCAAFLILSGECASCNSGPAAVVAGKSVAGKAVAANVAVAADIAVVVAMDRDAYHR